MFKPRCSKCGCKTPTPISVRKTSENDYVKLKCHCGHVWESKGESAFRLAVAYKLAKYGG